MENVQQHDDDHDDEEKEEGKMDILPGERTGNSGVRVQELPAETAPFQLMEAVWTPLPVMLTSTMAA